MARRTSRKPDEPAEPAPADSAAPDPSPGDDPDTPPAADAAPEAPPADDPPILRTRDLVDRVARHAGIRRNAARPLVDAVLAELAVALAAGQTLSLPPLGKVTVARTRPSPGGAQVVVCRVRLRGARPATSHAADPGDEALADPDEGR